MIEIPNKIDKSELTDKPRAVFNGIIEEIDTEDKAQKAIEILRTHKIVGFDTETRPSFTKGLGHKIALLQLSTNDIAYLFRLNKMGIPDCVADFLTDSDIIKVGLSVKDDFNSLASRRELKPAGFVELQELCGGMGIEEKGLQKMYGLAALDAWACLRIYHYVMDLKKSGDYVLIRKYAEESNTEEG